MGRPVGPKGSASTQATSARDAIARKRKGDGKPPYALLFGSAIGVVVAAVAGRHIWSWLRRPISYGSVVPTPRLDARDPDSLEKFFSLYHGKRPVVIEHAMDSWPAMRWTPESLATRCPQGRIPVYHYDSTLTSNDWAALGDAGDKQGEMNFAEFLRTSFGHSSKPQGALYGLELALRNECPELLEDIRIPSFFTDDLLVKHYKKGAWPTMIAGGIGTRTGLHIDTHDLPFWVAMVVGRKHWRTFVDTDKAMMQYFLPSRNGFDFDAFYPDFEKFPGLGEALVYDTQLLPGDVIYAPPGAAHAAINLEDSISLSANYLDTRALSHMYNVTCNKPHWQEAKICWAYSDKFDKHKIPSLGSLREKTFFEFAGYRGPAEWCAFFLENLKERAAKQATLLRKVPIVEAYCKSQPPSAS